MLQRAVTDERELDRDQVVDRIADRKVRDVRQTLKRATTGNSLKLKGNRSARQKRVIQLVLARNVANNVVEPVDRAVPAAKTSNELLPVVAKNGRVIVFCINREIPRLHRSDCSVRGARNINRAALPCECSSQG